MERREFLKTTALTAASMAMANCAETTEKDMSQSSNPPTLPKREYGKTGIELSVIGFGGIVVMNAEQSHANRVVGEAVERGVNYFDVAPAYGNAEIILGPALEPYRKNCFLACKTARRDREGAAEDLEQSLKRLRTDHLDLYQLHSITDVKEDVDTVFAKDGAMGVFIEAKKSGKVRFLGFSAHSVEAAYAALDRYDFDSVLFPLNFACVHEGDFGQQIRKKAEERGAARLALKAMAKQAWPEDHPDRAKYGKCWYQPLTDPEEADLALRWTLSQPVTAAIPPGEEPLFRVAMDIAMRYRPVTEEETDRLNKLAGDLNPIFRT
jgi:aryl-alcohol dehydrogenase-like predicted oxidoreductase